MSKIILPKVKNTSNNNQKSKNKQTIGYYPLPASHSQPPDFGPNCVPAAVARQIDAHFAKIKKNKDKSKKLVEIPIQNRNFEENNNNIEIENFSLCIPQNPSRFSSMQVNDKNHPRPSLLQNPQRIVAEGPFAINEPVKPSIVSLNFDGLQPLRLNQYQYNSDTKKTLKDLHLLVQASLRSRNIKDEASAYFNIGLLYESEGHLKKANEFYSKYLQTLGADSDPLVFNRIAVNYQLMNQFEESIEWNMRHLSFSRSMFETIAANCNIALIYKAKGENSRSVEFYKAALDTALEMEETEDSPFFTQIEKIRDALQNQITLADSESKVNDLGSSQLSIQSFGDRLEKNDLNKRHIDAQIEYFNEEHKISMEQGDLSTAYSALISSGKLNCVYGDFEKAELLYRESLKIAKQINSPDLINHSKISIGIMTGNKELRIYGLYDEFGDRKSVV